MNWLARLKNQNAPDDHPTETTKRVSVVFVGIPDGHLQKKRGETPAANDLAPTPNRAGVDGDLIPQTGEQEPDAAALDPDRWCWPHTQAMNNAEIDTLAARLARFTDRGVTVGDAECLADRLALRDREQDERAVCLECTHLQRAGRCGNWQRAGIAIRTWDAQLAGDFVNLLQRCDGFTQSIHFQRGKHGQA